MERLARLVHRRRKTVIGVWLLLTIFGVYSAARVSNRWLEQFSIPGYSAYEANQRTLHTFGNGEQFALVGVITAPGRDVTKVPGVAKAFAQAAAKNPGGRYSDYFTTHDAMYLSPDRHTAFAEIFPAGNPGFDVIKSIKPTRATLKRLAPTGTQAYLTGHDPLYSDSSGGDSNGPSVLLEALIGGLGAFFILLFVFGTLPAIAMPLLVAAASILNTFTLVWALTYVTDVSLVVEFLIALVGLGIAIDYALLVIFRYREELRHGNDVETALVTTMRTPGRSVIVSGSTVAVGLLSMLVLPLPFIRSIGIGGMLIPAVSVLAAITLLPAMLALLGTRINSVRVLPRRIVEGSDASRRVLEPLVALRHAAAAAVAITGLVIVGVLLVFGAQLNPSEAQQKDLPGAGDAVDGRAALTAAGVAPGVYKPFEILVEGNVTPAALARIAAKVGSTPGVVGAAAPAQWRRAGAAIVEAIPEHDGAAKDVRPVISDLQHDVLPARSAARPACA